MMKTEKEVLEALGTLMDLKDASEKILGRYTPETRRLQAQVDALFWVSEKEFENTTWLGLGEEMTRLLTGKEKTQCQ